VENGDQAIAKGKEAWKQEIFGTVAPECVAVLPSVPDETPCGTCVLNKFRVRIRMVTLAIAFGKFDLAAKGDTRKRDLLGVLLERLSMECIRIKEDKVLNGNCKIKPIERQTNVTRHLQPIINRADVLLTNSKEIFPMLARRIHVELAEILQGFHEDMTRGAFMSQINRLCLDVERHKRRVQAPTAVSRSIVWMWAHIEQTDEDIKEGVKKDLYGEFPSWLDAAELVRESAPDLLRHGKQAKYMQTFSETFIENLGNVNETAAANIEYILSNNKGGVYGAALCDAVCAISRDNFADACSQFTNHPIPASHDRKGRVRKTDIRFRCSGCAFGRCSSHMSGGILQNKEIDDVWNTQFALTGIVANLMCNMSAANGFECLDVGSAVEHCKLHCGEAFWRSAYVRTRIQESTTASAVLTHEDGYFLPTLPEGAWHKMSVACIATTLGFFASFVSPVIDLTVKKCSSASPPTLKRFSFQCKQTTSALKDAYVAFLAMKGNAVVDAIACMRLLQYLHLYKNRKSKLPIQVLKSGDKTVSVPTMPLEFGVQRNNDELINLIEETFTNSRGMARYKTEHTIVGFDQMLKCVNNGVLGTTTAHAAEADSDVYNLLRSTSKGVVSLVSRVSEFVRNAKVRHDRLPSDANTFFVRVNDAFNRLNHTYPTIFKSAGIFEIDVILSVKWNIPKLACGLFFSFKDFNGKKIVNHTTTEIRKRGYGFDNMAVCSEEMKKSAVPPIRTLPKSDDAVLSERLEELDDALRVLVVGKRADTYEYSYDAFRSASPTRMQAETERVNELTSSNENREAICKCLYNFFKDTSAVMEFVIFIERCKQIETERRQKLTTTDMTCRAAKQLVDTGLVVMDFFIEKAGGKECMHNDAQFRFGCLSASAFMNSPEARNDDNWERVRCVAMSSTAFHGLVTSYTIRTMMESPYTPCLLQSSPIRPPESVVNAFEPIYSVVRSLKAEVTKHMPLYPNGRVTMNKGQIDLLNSIKKDIQTTKYKLLRSTNDGKVVLKDYELKELNLGIRSFGYVAFVSTGILHALIVKYNDCLVVLRSQCWSAGHTSDAEIVSMYQKIVIFLIECATDKFKERIVSGFHFNRVVVSFLCKVAFTYGTDNERKAARLISESGICFFTGKLGCYAPISSPEDAGPSGSSTPQSNAFEFNEEEMVDAGHVPENPLPFDGEGGVPMTRFERIRENACKKKAAEDAEEGGIDAGDGMRVRSGIR
jgi:hypothetical protein